MGKFYNTEAIKEILPQRYPVLMLDRAQCLEEGVFVGLKNVSINESYFQGHFPNHPIMPGVLQVEAVKQLGEIAFREKIKVDANCEVYFRQAENIKFRRPALPGDRLKVDVKIEFLENNEAKVIGKVSSCGGVNSEAVLVLAIRELKGADKFPVLFDEYDKNDETPVDVTKIMSFVPHRFPFLLIDHIAKFSEEEVVTVKNITANEPFFSNVNESYATVPESILCEMAAQSGCTCILSKPENIGKLGYFMAISKAESIAPIYAGDRLCWNVNIPPTKSRFGKGWGEVSVDGEVRFKVSLMFAVVDK